MKKQLRGGPVILTAVCLSFAVVTLAHTRTNLPFQNPVQKGTPMSSHGTGTFVVKIIPQAPDGIFEDATLGRMTIDKQIHGDLEATSKETMLTAGTDVKGSAGYVAIERITGTLQGRTGSFVLQHTGTMNRGAFQLSITVVPDSGTGQLVGITGKFIINIAGGKHSFAFDYTLP
jgi:hypothetical protein